MLKRITVLVFILLSFQLFAQDNTFKPKISDSYALMFQVSELNLDSYNGATISGKYHFKNQDAIRAYLSLYGTSNETNEDVTYEYDYYNDTSSKREHESLELKIGAQYLFYTKPLNEVAFYYGSGLFYNYSGYNDVNENRTIGLDQIDRDEDVKNQSLIGLDIVVGADWFLRNNLSISFEYGCYFYYQWDNRDTPKNNGSYVSKYEFSEVGINYSNAKLGLSLYF